MDTPSGWRIQVRLEMGGSLGEGSGKTGGRDCEGWKEVSFPKAKETRGKKAKESKIRRPETEGKGTLKRLI